MTDDPGATLLLLFVWVALVGLLAIIGNGL